MTKKRARDRRRKVSRREASPQPFPRWKLPAFVFGFMLVFIGTARVAWKREEFGWPDMLFVLLFALAMALIAYRRPKLFK